MKPSLGVESGGAPRFSRELTTGELHRTLTSQLTWAVLGLVGGI